MMVSVHSKQAVSSDAVISKFLFNIFRLFFTTPLQKFYITFTLNYIQLYQKIKAYAREISGKYVIFVKIE